MAVGVVIEEPLPELPAPEAAVEVAALEAEVPVPPVPNAPPSETVALGKDESKIDEDVVENVSVDVELD